MWAFVFVLARALGRYVERMLDEMSAPEFLCWMRHRSEHPWGLPDAVIAAWKGKDIEPKTAEDMAAPLVSALRAQGLEVRDA